VEGIALNNENKSASDIILSENDISENSGYGDEGLDKSQFRQPRKRGHGKAVIIVAASFAALLLIVGIIIAVTHIHKDKPYDNTEPFYFSSDLLKEDGAEYSVYGDICFTVCNFADELRCSMQDIESVSITVSSEGKDVTSKCIIKNELDLLPAEKNTVSSIAITVPEELNGFPLEVKAVSAPIEITLKGIFTVLPGWGYELKDEAGSVNAELVVWANEETTLKVTWNPEELIADPTNSYVKASDSSESCEVTLAAGTGAEIFFFKTDVDSDHTGTDAVTVEKTAGAAVKGGNDEQN